MGTQLKVGIITRQKLDYLLSQKKIEMLNLDIIVCTLGINYVNNNSIEGNFSVFLDSIKILTKLANR